MNLSRRDRVKVQAGLALLHDGGWGTGEVTRVAETLINSGTPVRKAYETAFNKFVQRTPSAHAPLQRLGQLLDASDDRTMARYGVALTKYIETGDDAGMREMLPSIQHAMAEMARITGDAGFADNLPDPTPAPAVPAAPDASPGSGA